MIIGFCELLVASYVLLYTGPFSSRSWCLVFQGHLWEAFIKVIDREGQGYDNNNNAGLDVALLSPTEHRS